MKLNKNKISKRALKRFKWMCITGLSMIALSWIADKGIAQIQEFQFVDAGEDLTFEQDDIYSSYIESAKLQQKLLTEGNRVATQSWTMEQYQQQQRRKLVGKAYAQEYQAVMGSILSGDEEWYTKVPDNDFDKLPEVKMQNTLFPFKGKEYKNYVHEKMAQGYVEEYFDDQRCNSFMISLPGISLLPAGLMGIVYLLFLGYLFLGISISADIFMEAIEVITSKTAIVELYDEKSEQNYHMEVPIWNPTLANLTLMAFGSSAPEIILSVLEALKDLGSPAGELGPSTIVGSAAFNLLVISGVSVAAVGGTTGEVKKVDDLGVFATTGLFSIFAYVWLYMCLTVNSPEQVTITEAALTLSYFFILLILAFGADKYNQRKKAKVDNENVEKENHKKMKKSILRSIAKNKGEIAVLSAAQGQQAEGMTELECQQVRDLYQEVIECNDLSALSLDDLMTVLKPESLHERFAARKANQVGHNKEFLEIKGQKFQIENQTSVPVKQENDLLAFKCLHYSVTESAGTMTVIIVKKNNNQECSFGIRTRESTAKPNKEYTPIDEIVTMKKRETELTKEIQIHDNQDWQPDMDFYIEMYDTNTTMKLFGDDTECRVTILDEDFPGKLGFEKTEIIASKNNDKVDIIIKRSEGTDGQISCMIRTEPLVPDSKSKLNAVEFEDYLPKHEKIEFASGESEKIVPIYLVNDRLPPSENQKDAKELPTVEPEGDDSEEEDFGPKFKVVIEKAEPNQVKISKKNCCTVEIQATTKNVEKANEHTKMINYFVAQKNPGWGDQFKLATMLCPQVDEDDLIVSQVTLSEALTHFMLIGWKILFSAIPPCEWGGGWPAFGVALILIGAITAIVAEVASVLGCVLGLKEAVTAITLVAVGTSLPDTFASMTAATSSEFADAAIGNVTGSNSVNVFVGLGLPWLISSCHAASNNQIYVTPPGNLAFSVMLFLITSVTCFIVLGLRRSFLEGELGGPAFSRNASCAFLICLWLIYVVCSSLKAYGVIAGI